MPAPLLYGAHVRANGIRQHYLRYGGKGRPLIVVPGISSPAVTWGFVGERLGEDYDTYVLDVRGRGLSESGAHLKYTLDEYAKDVAEFAAELGLKDYLVVGHSMGGRIAIRLGRKYPQGIARLAIIDPPVSGPGRRPYVHAAEFYFGPIKEAVAGRMSIDVVRKAYPKWTETSQRLRAEWLHTCDLTAIAETVRGFQEDDIHADLPQLAMPALLVVAGKAGVITDDDIAEVRKLAPNMLVGKVPHTGHMIPFEDLEAFLASVRPFLAEA